MALLESCGYVCTKAGGSLGLFDVIGIGARDIRLLQVKSGSAGCSPAAREQLKLTPVPANCSIEVWRFIDRRREPVIERL